MFCSNRSSRLLMLLNGSRGFAASATASPGPQQLRLTLVAPHITLLKDVPVKQVNLSTEDGDLGVLAGHLPMVLQLRPGLIEVVPVEGGEVPKRYFGSGGFATVNPDSSVQVAAMEAVDVEQIDGKRVAEGLIAAEHSAATAKSDEEKVQAAICLQVYRAMANALEKRSK